VLLLLPFFLSREREKKALLLLLPPLSRASEKKLPPLSHASSHRYDQVATKMLALLHRWQERFPGSHNGELFVFAESFGGHYAPAVARHYFDAYVLSQTLDP
jgi:hypothetical protein